MAFEEVRRCVGMIAVIGTQTSCDEDVLDRLPRDPMNEPPHCLDDLGVAPAGLFPDPGDCVSEMLSSVRGRPGLAFASGLGRYADPRVQIWALTGQSVP